MAHEITQDDHYTENESARWEFTVEEDGSAKDISGASIEWYLLHDDDDDLGDAAYDHDTTGITASLTTDGTDGRVDVVIDQDVIAEDYYWQVLVVDDTGPGKQKWSGPFPVGSP